MSSNSLVTNPPPTIDPLDRRYGSVPLWVIHGYESFPSLLLCKILWVDQRSQFDGAYIWGFSIYRYSAGFRTMGQLVSDWISSELERGRMQPRFYDDQEAALDMLRQLTTPNPNATTYESKSKKPKFSDNQAAERGLYVPPRIPGIRRADE